jgi:hypothetical protein
MLMIVLHWHSGAPRGCVHVDWVAPLQTVSRRKTCDRQTSNRKNWMNRAGLGKLSSLLTEIAECSVILVSLQSDQSRKKSIFCDV